MEAKWKDQENGVPMGALTNRIQMHPRRQEERREGRGELQKRWEMSNGFGPVMVTNL